MKEQESRTIVEDLQVEIVDRVLNNYVTKENYREKAQEQDEKLKVNRTLVEELISEIVAKC